MALDAAPPSRAWHTPALAALLCVLTLGVFAPVLGHEWLNYDDDIYITGNPALQLGLSSEGIAWAFSTFYGANWFPLTWLSWLADYQLHGLDPRAFHATKSPAPAAPTPGLMASGSPLRPEPRGSTVPGKHRRPSREPSSDPATRRRPRWCTRPAPAEAARPSSSCEFRS